MEKQNLERRLEEIRAAANSNNQRVQQLRRELRAAEDAAQQLAGQAHVVMQLINEAEGEEE